MRSRLLWTLSSGSLAFRSHLFTEWYEDRIQPFVHYLPVCAPSYLCNGGPTCGERPL